MLRVKGSLDLRRPPAIKVLDSKLRFTSCLRYLGIMYGHSLTVSEYVDYISGRAKAKFSSITARTGSKWGYGFRARSLLYKAIFVSIATYGAAGWAHKLTQEHLAALNDAQRFALIRVPSLLERSSPAYMDSYP